MSEKLSDSSISKEKLSGFKCKLGGDDWRNKEGFILIDGSIICDDWDIDCQQCLVETLEAENQRFKEKIIDNNIEFVGLKDSLGRLVDKWRKSINPKALGCSTQILHCADELEKAIRGGG